MPQKRDFVVSWLRPDGTEKTPEEVGDEIAEELETQGIDSSSLKITAVEYHCDSPLVQTVFLPVRFITTSQSKG